MGIANGSQTVGLVNSVGEITYCTRNGKTISRKKIVTNPSQTPAQMIQRCCFGFAGHLCKRFHEVIVKGFMKNKSDFSSSNTFIQLNTKIITVTPDESSGNYKVEMDYSKLKCADGDLFPPEVSGTIDKENGKIVITVDTPIPGGRSYPDDLIYVAVYEKDKELCLLHELGLRSETGSKEIALPQRWDADSLEVYAFVNNGKKRLSSPSVYIGH